MNDKIQIGFTGSASKQSQFFLRRESAVIRILQNDTLTGSFVFCALFSLGSAIFTLGSFPFKNILKNK